MCDVILQLLQCTKDYVELMQKCDPNNITNDLFDILIIIDTGSITTNNSDTMYKSRPLSSMVKSAESTRSLRSQNVLYDDNALFVDKRKFNNNLIENNEKGKV